MRSEDFPINALLNAPATLETASFYPKTEKIDRKGTELDGKGDTTNDLSRCANEEVTGIGTFACSVNILKKRIFFGLATTTYLGPCKRQIANGELKCPLGRYSPVQFQERVRKQ